MDRYRSSTSLAAVAFIAAGVTGLVATVRHRGLLVPAVALVMVGLVWALLYAAARGEKAPARAEAVRALAKGSAILAALLALVFLFAATH